MRDNEPPPSVNPWLIAVSVMLATFMEMLDTSIANVSLPHIAGNLSASSDEATWVITSYLVSNAVVLPASGWFSRYFGRKRFLLTCVGIFTFASFLCGIAPTLGILIFARVLQGAGGGALQPLAQAIMLESFPAAKRGVAMAAYAIGVVVAPILGPLFGGWITDNYAWRWIFYINIPIGIIAVMMIRRFIYDPLYIRHAKPGRVDGIGFGLMALGLALFQFILDKGQEDDWFSAPWICWCSVICAVSLISFVIWELRTDNPIVNLRVFANRNFAVGTILITIVGFAVYVPTALLPQFLQELMGYTALDSGSAQSSRGLGVLLTTFLAGYLTSRVDNRKLIGLGFLIAGFSIFWLSKINLDISMSSITWPNFLQGMGMALIFVPLMTTSMGMLSNEQIGNASGIYNLMRNIGGSIGISLATTMVVRHAQAHQTILAAHVTLDNPAYQQRLQALQGPLGSTPTTYADHSPAVAAIYQTVVHQATAMAYVDTLRWLALLCLVCAPIVLLLKKVEKGEAVMAH